MDWISLAQYKSRMMGYNEPSGSIKAGNRMASYTVLMCRKLFNTVMQKSGQLVPNMFIRNTAVFSPYIQKFVSVYMQ
jgi:hypothetical protein